MQQRSLPAVVALAFVLAGCGSDLSVTNVQLGRSLNADQTVANHTTRFTPNDTVYVSVQVAGTGSGELSARWTYLALDRVIDERKKPVSRAGATEFHMQATGGFPPGEYKVEIFLNGQPAGERRFQVEPER